MLTGKPDHRNHNNKVLIEQCRSLFKSATFVLLFLAGVLGAFPLFVPPYCIPLFSTSINLSSSTGAGLTAGFNFASAVGRIVSGILSDRFGALNVLFMTLILLGLSMCVIWPFSTTLGVTAAFVIASGIFVGGFFSTMPTVVGNVFGSARMPVTMGMVLTGWTGGYIMVRFLSLPLFHCG